MIAGSECSRNLKSKGPDIAFDGSQLEEPQTPGSVDDVLTGEKLKQESIDSRITRRYEARLFNSAVEQGAKLAKREVEDTKRYERFRN